MGIKGRVYLVGAGPGDPSLITLKGVQVLRQADVVLYDYLVHPSLFQHCSGTAKILCVGKKKGAHSKQQFEINRLLLKHAKMGLIVVRLKGGDPCVFGRGGEEMQYLKKHLIPFEVIPGVSAALSVPVLAGIPVTHRQLSRSLAVITGTTKESKQDLNIPNVDTLIVLMGVSHLAEIARKISDADGYSPSTPAALIYKGSTAEEKIILGDLATIAEKKKAANLTPPAILVVGYVVSLATELNTRQLLPLAGQRVIMLRENHHQDVVDALSLMGADVLLMPMIKIEPILKNLDKIDLDFLYKVDVVIFTSANAVRFVMETLYRKHYDARVFAGKKCVAVGPKTAEKLMQFGVTADAVPKQFNVQSILDFLPGNLTHQTLFLPIAENAGDEFKKALESRGAVVKHLKIYETLKGKVTPKQLDLQDGDAVFFTSGAMVDHFFKNGFYRKQRIKPVCIGPVTAAKVKQYYKADLILSKTATTSAMVDALVEARGVA